MILDDIVDKRKKDIEDLKDSGYYLEIMNSNMKRPVKDFKGAFLGDKIGIIGEIKKASPSKGIIAEDFDITKIAEIYKDVKVDAISVLTEESFFKGSVSNLKIAKEVTCKPILRKDFIVDKFQIYETKAIGADAVLLIAEVLKEKLYDYYRETLQLGLHSLVEVHNEEELETALSCGAEIIGINNRNLKTFEVDLGITERLLNRIPKDKIVISESGIKSPSDIRVLKEMGIKGLLIGESLMRMLYDKVRMNGFLLQLKEV